MAQQKKELSILIPVYNQVCVEMVERLDELCQKADGLEYEIIVADDCSSDKETVETNRSIGKFPHCRLIEKKENGGAGATRNVLARESRYGWLLFLDCDMRLPDERFIERYLECENEAVINGGIRIEGGEAERHCLRFLYETKAAPMHTAEQRQLRPYKSFRSTNFLVARQVMLDNPFHEPMKRYEDVFFGKTLKQRGVKIRHIDNPVVMSHFDTNSEYIAKVEKDMTMLHRFRRELKGYSPLLTAVDTLRHWVVPIWAMRLFHKIFGRMIRRNLTGGRPKLALLNIYKVGFFLNIK